MSEVGFLFCKLTQLVNNRFDAVSERMRQQFERNEKHCEAVRTGKTQEAIKKMSNIIDRLLVDKVVEEKNDTIKKENSIAGEPFSKWKQIVRKQDRVSPLHNLKQDLHKEFFKMCELELSEMVKDIHNLGISK